MNVDNKTNYLQIIESVDVKEQWNVIHVFPKLL